MAQDIFDIEAKQRGTSRAAVIAFYRKRNEGGQAVVGKPSAPAKQPTKPDTRGPMQRLLDALK
jgi:hypothetical protein